MKRSSNFSVYARFSKQQTFVPVRKKRWVFSTVYYSIRIDDLQTTFVNPPISDDRPPVRMEGKKQQLQVNLLVEKITRLLL